MANNTESPTFFGECFQDSDCPLDTQRCYYPEYPWQKESGNICDCDAWFGYVGKNCDKFGPTSYIYLCFVLLSGSIAAYGTYQSFLTARILLLKRLKVTQESALAPPENQAPIAVSEDRDEFEFKQQSSLVLSQKKSSMFIAEKKPKRFKNINSIEFTSVLSFIGMFVDLAYRVGMLVAVCTPHNLLLRDETNINGKAKANKVEGHFERYVQVIFGLITAFCLINFSLVWILNSRQTMKLKPQTENKVVRFKYSLIILEVLILVLFFVFPRSFLGALSIGIIVIVVPIFYLAEKYLQKLRNSMTTAELLSVLLGRITRSRRILVLGAVIAVIGGGLYTGVSSESSWRMYCEPGRVCPATVGGETMVLGITICLASICDFLHETVVRPLKKSSRTRDRTATADL